MVCSLPVFIPMLLITFPCAEFLVWASHGIQRIATLNQPCDQTKSLSLTTEVTGCFLMAFLSLYNHGIAVILEKNSSPLSSSLLFDYQKEELMT